MSQQSNELLRYEISDWHQVGTCQSNSSRNLYLTLSEFVQQDIVNGQILKVQHKLFGTLFAAPIKLEGKIVTNRDADGQLIPYMATPDILKQLQRFGFYITYKTAESLPSQQLYYLSTLHELSYNKLNIIRVKSKDTSIENPIVAFNSDRCPDLLVYGATISNADFINHLTAGHLVLVPDDIRFKFSWDWLTYVCSIDDILEENSHIRGIDLDANGTPDIEESQYPLFEAVDDEEEQTNDGE